jgi:hypothetical protein
VHIQIESLEKRTVARNTLLLSVGMAALYGMTQLSVAVATITFVNVTGFQGLVGLGPAIFLGTGPSPPFRRDGLWTASVGFPCLPEVSLSEYWVACSPGLGRRYVPC